MIAKRNSHTADLAVRRQREAAPGTAGPAKESAAPTMTRFIVEHPVLALSAALIAGVFLGWLVKRRK